MLIYLSLLTCSCSFTKIIAFSILPYVSLYNCPKQKLLKVEMYSLTDMY